MLENARLKGTNIISDCLLYWEIWINNVETIFKAGNQAEILEAK